MDEARNKYEEWKDDDESGDRQAQLRGSTFVIVVINSGDRRVDVVYDFEYKI